MVLMELAESEMEPVETELPLALVELAETKLPFETDEGGGGTPLVAGVGGDKMPVRADGDGTPLRAGVGEDGTPLEADRDGNRTPHDTGRTGGVETPLGARKVD